MIILAGTLFIFLLPSVLGPPLLLNVLLFQEDSDLPQLATKITLAAGCVGEVFHLGSQSTGFISKVDS